MKTYITLIVHVIALFEITSIQGERPEITRSITSGAADTNADIDLGDEKREVVSSGKPGGADKIDEDEGYYWTDRELGGKGSKSTDYPTMYPTLYPTLAPTWCGKSGKSKSSSCYSGSWSWDRGLSRDARDGDGPVRNLNGSGKPGSRDMNIDLVDKAKEEEEPVEISSNMNGRRRINGGQTALQVQEDNNVI